MKNPSKVILSLLLRGMKLTGYFFNVFVAISLVSCKTTRLAMTPNEEFKAKAPFYYRSDPQFDALLLRQAPSLEPVLRNPDHQVQIIYTQIDRNKKGRPSFTHHYYQVQPHQYFYPASTVKLPAAILALQKLNELAIDGLDKYTTMITEGAYSGQTPVYNDPTSEDGRPSIAQYIKKILLVSDNDAFNRLYEFLGQEYLNNTLHRMGYDSVQIIHRLDIALTEEQNRSTNPVRFYDTASSIVYEQPLMVSELPYQPRYTLMGKGYLKNGELVNAPFDFSQKNRLTLVDLHSILMSVIFPEQVRKKQRFQLTSDDYAFLHRYMSMWPRESTFPQYDTATYPDAYVKFLLYGGSGNIKDSYVRIFNKVGDAYGFLTETAYIVDFENDVEFLLSATVYCNADGIFNDNKYEYETIGLPFLKELGRAVYDWERQRPRKYRPDLSAFRFSYRDSTDYSGSIKQ